MKVRRLASIHFWIYHPSVLLNQLRIPSLSNNLQQIANQTRWGVYKKPMGTQISMGYDWLCYCHSTSYEYNCHRLDANICETSYQYPLKSLLEILSSCTACIISGSKALKDTHFLALAKEEDSSNIIVWQKNSNATLHNLKPSHRGNSKETAITWQSLW